MEEEGGSSICMYNHNTLYLPLHFEALNFANVFPPSLSTISQKCTAACTCLYNQYLALYNFFICSTYLCKCVFSLNNKSQKAHTAARNVWLYQQRQTDSLPKKQNPYCRLRFQSHTLFSRRNELLRLNETHAWPLYLYHKPVQLYIPWPSLCASKTLQIKEGGYLIYYGMQEMNGCHS